LPKTRTVSGLYRAPTFIGIRNGQLLGNEACEGD
jgi:hypothetical protein